MILNLFGSFPQAVQLGVQMSSMFLSMKHQHSIKCLPTFKSLKPGLIIYWYWCCNPLFIIHFISQADTQIKVWHFHSLSDQGVGMFWHWYIQCMFSQQLLESHYHSVRIGDQGFRSAAYYWWTWAGKAWSRYFKVTCIILTRSLFLWHRNQEWFSRLIGETVKWTTRICQHTQTIH